MREVGPFKAGRVRRLAGWFKVRPTPLAPPAPGDITLTPEAVLAGLEVEIDLVRHALESVRRDGGPARAKPRSNNPFTQ